ncbi:LIM-domain-containing protein [Exidia glandulosa HHB12029]|uniref:Cysteine-rich protein 1 n=1 Tax=Exidia glandulosa HHB12029 TaxID=1314781 RepID=A0A165ITS9_EXIGL|nr:LIM-domain-containing protein [Exidia glandulosa HHB12029]
MSFGGTHYCPTCDKAVYAAEQVMGPGRKMCLKCKSCSKRLDSFSLVEHNFESCHVRLFGTRDLRSANLSPSSPTASPSTSFSPLSTPALTSRSSTDLTKERVNSPDDEDDDVDEPRTPPPPSHAFLKSDPAVADPRPLKQSLTGSAAFLPRAQPLRPTATGTSPSKVQRYASPSPGKAAARFASPNPLCPVCDKAVYFAEQVKASGRIWHKACLRCTECRVLLDSNRLTEKDGDPLCRSCYSKLHGPQGSGYALLGR